MTTQAASKAESVESYVQREVASVEDSSPPEHGLLRWFADAVKAYLPRGRRRVTEAQFVWDVPPTRVADVSPSTVYCVELPVSNPLGILESYVHAGVAPDHVVFVGDPLTLKDDMYCGITRKGALVHDTPKKGRRQQAPKDLAAYFEPAGTNPYPRLAENPNPYTYNPGPPKVTPEQLQALVDAIGRRRA